MLKYGDSRLYLSTACDVGEPPEYLILDEWFDPDLLSLMGVRYLVSQRPIQSEEVQEIDTSHLECGEVLGCYKNHIYENPNAYPAVFARAEARTLPSAERLLETLQSIEASALSKRAYLLAEEGTTIAQELLVPGEFQYRLLSTGFDNLELYIELETAQIVILNMAYSPYWRLSVDDVHQELFPAYHMLSALYLPAGSHDVQLTYEPPYSVLGYYFKLQRFISR